MRSATEDGRGGIRRALERVDVRLTVRLAGVTAILTSLLSCGLLAFAVKEGLEEQAAVADAVVASVADAVAGGADVGTLHPGAAYRVRDAAGHERAAGGRWPAPDALRDVSLRSAFAARAGDYLLRERRAAGGTAIAAAWPLGHFARERRELVVRAAAVVLTGLLAAIALGMWGARRALQPLRDTTAAIRAIDPRHLATRVPVRGTGDDVDALAAATNDVLARLQWAFERLAGFSADAAHELRTPVNRMLNTAEVALTTTTDADAKDDALARIHAAAEAMRGTIEQLLLLARGEDGRLPVTRESVELDAVVRGLGELYAPAAERLAKTLIVVPAAAVVSADRGLLERAIANLVDNALGHSGSPATIRISVEPDDAAVAVAVEDSGPGIPVADRERVFDRFTRLDEARAPGGAGLGLPIARMVARLHGGDLVVATSTLGGAAFRLVLPRT